MTKSRLMKYENLSNRNEKNPYVQVKEKNAKS